MKVRARLLAFLAIPLSVWAPHALAGSAPQYVSSDPARGEELHKAPARVEITFSEPLDPSSEMAVADECGRRVDDQQVEIFANQMSVGIAKRPAGEYTVHFTAVGVAGATGSSHGRYSFVVHAGPTCPGGTEHEGHHGGSGGGGHEGGGHEGEGHDPAGHDEHGEDHSGTAGAHDHVSAAPRVHDHGDPGHEDHHPPADRGSDGHEGRDGAQIAEPRRLAGASPTSRPLGASIAVLALALAGVFGISGGWVLRVSRSS